MIIVSLVKLVLECRNSITIVLINITILYRNITIALNLQEKSLVAKTARRGLPTATTILNYSL